jgi:hypothetical protein
MNRNVRLMVGTVLVWTLLACGAAVRDVGRTLNDAADIACTLFATDHTAELQGLTPRQFCDIKHNFDPFLDEILSAQRVAGTRLGIQSPPSVDVEE